MRDSWVVVAGRPWRAYPAPLRGVCMQSWHFHILLIGWTMLAERPLGGIHVCLQCPSERHLLSWKDSAACMYMPLTGLRRNHTYKEVLATGGKSNRSSFHCHKTQSWSPGEHFGEHIPTQYQIYKENCLEVLNYFEPSNTISIIHC